MSLCVADLPYIVTGVSATFITAALPSLMAVNICNAITISQKEDKENDSDKYWSTAMMFIILGLAGGFAMFLQVIESHEVLCQISTFNILDNNVWNLCGEIGLKNEEEVF